MDVGDNKRFLPEGKYLMMGNVAMSEGALAAGLTFFGGYPITPSTEVIEHLSARLPQVGGVCMQMEDELASINAVIGASLVGAKAMTATSGPGIALMTETISMAANLEIPFVFCDVQVKIPSKEKVEKMVIERKIPEDMNGKFSYKDESSGKYIIPEPPIMGTDYCPAMFLSQPHNIEGMPTSRSLEFTEMLIKKITSNIDKIALTDSYRLDDAEIIIIAYGLPVRASYRAVDLARKEGIKVGIFKG